MVRIVFVCGVIVLIVSVAIGWLIVRLSVPLTVDYAYVSIAIVPLSVGIYLTVKGLRMQTIENE